MTTREDILKALQGLIQSDQFFPVCEIDADLPEEWDGDTPGLAEGLQHAVAVQDGPVEVTAEALGEGDRFELLFTPEIAYGVIAVDAYKVARRARREAAAAKIEALIAADPTLGLGDQVYAVLDQPAERDDSEAANDLPPIAILRVPVSVNYCAATAAG